MNNNWIPAKYLPDKGGCYIVYVHAPNSMKEDPLYIPDEGEDIDYGYITVAYFNKAQGGIWEMEFDKEAYGTDLTKIDTDNQYYISHWMSLPDKPMPELRSGYEGRE